LNDYTRTAIRPVAARANRPSPDRAAVVQTVSRTLKEEVTFDRSHVTSLDRATYPIITFPEVPEVVIELIDRPTEKPWGAGEPSAAVVPSAISNAVFDAIGVRLRSVPFKPAKVRPAIQGA
jgi:nicotinate dehydrogenase subunit B